MYQWGLRLTNVKKLLILLFSIFLLSSPAVFADDISDFEIEGISIGDSLLDYKTEDEILKEIERTKDWYLHLKEPNKYAHVYLVGEFLNYDYLGFMIKNNSSNTYVSNKNEKYTILSITGETEYIENFDGCIQKRDEIAEIFSKSFTNADRFQEIREIPSDPSGKSIVDQVDFVFDSGNSVMVYCTDYDETIRLKNVWQEGLVVVLMLDEINEWVSDY